MARVAAPLKPLNQPVGAAAAPEILTQRRPGIVIADQAAAAQFRHHEPDEALQAGRHDGHRDRLHDNGTRHDGAIFLLRTITDRVTAIFLAFQTQAWQTDAQGQAVKGTTGFEAPRYDFAGGGLGNLVPAAVPGAELTSLNRLADGTGRLVIANMSYRPLDVTNWSVVSPAGGAFKLPAQTIEPGSRCRWICQAT